MGMDIKFNHCDITLNPSGSLYLHNMSALILADLHLGKGVQLKDHGVPLIDQLDQKTIQKFHADLTQYAPALCVICGDLIHVSTPHLADQLRWFNNELTTYDTQFFLTLGNHDRYLFSDVLPLFRVVETYDLAGICCSHYPLNNGPNIAGHLHPGVKLKKGRITKVYKAFEVGEKHIVCPAYGHYTGAFSSISDQHDYYLCYQNSVKKLRLSNL